jgi:hypothetical protein
VASGDVQQEDNDKDCRQDASDPIRGDAMERHHLPTHCVAGICDLVASGDVQQEDNDKDCRQDASDPKIQIPIR